MPSYLVCSNWRSTTNISSIRVFDNLDDALDYYIDSKANRFYEVHSDREPYLINRKKVNKMIADRKIQN